MQIDVTKQVQQLLGYYLVHNAWLEVDGKNHLTEEEIAHMQESIKISTLRLKTDSFLYIRFSNMKVFKFKGEIEKLFG